MRDEGVRDGRLLLLSRVWVLCYVWVSRRGVCGCFVKSCGSGDGVQCTMEERLWRLKKMNGCDAMLVGVYGLRVYDSALLALFFGFTLLPFPAALLLCAVAGIASLLGMP